MTEQNSKFKNRDFLKWIIIGLSGFLALLLAFGIGMKIGTLKARYSYRWAENYHRNFAGPKGGFFGDWQKPSFPAGDFIESHGTFGEIIQINDNNLIVKGRNDVEKVIILTDKTIIQKGRKTAEKESLKVGDQIVVIGSPNEEGQIEAKLIRVFARELKNMPLPFKPFPSPFF